MECHFPAITGPWLHLELGGGLLIGMKEFYGLQCHWKANLMPVISFVGRFQVERRDTLLLFRPAVL